MNKAAKKASGKVAKRAEATRAVHVQDGDTHVVGVKALHVLLCRDGGSWFAQGLEIDYAACGTTVDDVKKNFADGLAQTISQNLTMHGSIEHILKLAPQDAWTEYLNAPPDAIKQKFSTIQAYKVVPQAAVGDSTPVFPFNEIVFVEQERSRVHG